MKGKGVYFVSFIILYTFLWHYPLSSQDYESILLRDITNNIDNYRNKTITLKLRLKYIDLIYKKIIFYDKKNQDIVFDISKIQKDSQFKTDILNLHEGMHYLVVFVIKGIGTIGDIVGDLISFEAFILQKLPEGNSTNR